MRLLQGRTARKVSKYGVFSGPYLDTFCAVTNTKTSDVLDELY